MSRLKTTSIVVSMLFVFLFLILGVLMFAVGLLRLLCGNSGLTITLHGFVLALFSYGLKCFLDKSGTVRRALEEWELE